MVRHDAAERNRNMDERLGTRTAPTRSWTRWSSGLEEFLEDDAGGQAVIYEMLSASRHSEEIRAELAELYRQWRERLAGWLRTKEREGVIRLQAEPEAVASILFSLGDGFGIQVLSDPDWDQQAAFDLGVATARRMLGCAPSASPTAAATASGRCEGCGRLDLDDLTPGRGRRHAEAVALALHHEHGHLQRVELVEAAGAGRLALAGGRPGAEAEAQDRGGAGRRGRAARHAGARGAAAGDKWQPAQIAGRAAPPRTATPAASRRCAGRRRAPAGDAVGRSTSATVKRATAAPCRARSGASIPPPARVTEHERPRGLSRRADARPLRRGAC